jgi:hypothetical protein
VGFFIHSFGLNRRKYWRKTSFKQTENDPDANQDQDANIRLQESLVQIQRWRTIYRGTIIIIDSAT